MGRIVMVAYRPKVGKEADLEALVRTHVPKLQGLGLATQRMPVTMRAADGTVVEVFEWSSPDAIEQAHANADVQAMWADFAEACDYLPIAEVPEAARLFSEFEALD